MAGLMNLYQLNGVWERIEAALVARADAAGKIDWRVSVDTRRRARPRPTRAGARGDGVERVEGEPDDHALGRSRGGWGTRTPRRRRGRPRSDVPAAHGRAGGGLPHDDPHTGSDQCQTAYRPAKSCYLCEFYPFKVW